MQLNDLRVNLTLDNNGFRMSVAESGRILRQFEQRLGSTADTARRSESALASFGSSTHRMIQTMGLARFALMDVKDIFLSLPIAIMKSAGEIERMTKLMEGLSTQGDATARRLEAAANVKFVFNMAQNAPFEVKALTDTFVKLKTGGIDPTNGSMEALVNSVAKFGGSSDQLKRASIAIQQMGGKGVVSMEELRQQLGEAVPTAMSAMAVGMKMSMSELTNAVSKGTVMSTMAMNKMLAVMAVDNASAAAAMMDTWTGMLERLKTQWELWKIGVAGQGMFDGAKGALKDLIEKMGSPAAASFGRRVGEGLSDAAKNIIDFTKLVASMWEEIKTAGEIFLLYWGASKIAPILMKSWNAINTYYQSVLAGAASVRTSIEMEADARRIHEVEAARAFQQRIARNEATIISNQAVADAGRRARAQELQDAIATNAAIASTYETRILAQQATIMAATPARSTAVAAVQRGTATAAQDVEAQILMRKAEAAQVATVATQRYTAALALETEALIIEQRALLASVGTMTPHTEALLANNAALAASAARHQANALAITEGNLAMAGMRAAGASVVGALGAILNPLTLLIAAIMAGAYAWSYFSDKAKQAAKDAQTAFDTKKRLEQGNYNEDTVKSGEANLETLNQKRQALEAAIETNQRLVDKSKVKGGGKIGEQLEKDKGELAGLIVSIGIFAGNLIKEKSKVTEAAADAAGRAVVQKYSEGVEKELSKSRTSVAAIEDKYRELERTQGKLTKPQEAARNTELHGARITADKSALSMWDQQIDRVRSDIAKQSIISRDQTKSEQERAAAAQELLELDVSLRGTMEKRAQVQGQIKNLEAPNQFGAGKDKKPAKEKTNEDSVLKAVDTERKALAKTKTSLDSALTEVLDAVQLRKDLNGQLDALIENDKGKTFAKKHTGADKEEYITMGIEKAALDRLKSLYGGLAKQRIEIERDYQDSIEMMRTQNFNKVEIGPAEKAVNNLERDLKDALARAKGVVTLEVAELKKLLAASRKDMEQEALTKGTTLFGENKKNIASAELGNVTNPRDHLRAQQALETVALKDKYDAQFRQAAASGAAINNLQEQFRQEDLQMTIRHTNEKKTPLEKLGDQWADVTKSMEDATARWADGAVNSFVDTAMTGKLQFADFAKSVIKDLLKIQIQKSFGSAINDSVGALGEWASKGLKLITSGPEKKEGEAGGGSVIAGAANADGNMFGASAMKMFNMGLQNLTGGSEKAADAIGSSLTASAISAATGIGQTVVAGAVKMTAEEAATVSLSVLAASAEAAAVALAQAAASAAGNAAASFFADGGIMSSAGSLPLKMYSNGGVADRPQLAVFGEGRMNEAFVPLPDGRTIPVTMKGNGGGGGTNVSIGITVNSDGSGDKSKASGNSASDWNKMASRIKEVVLEEMVEQKRAGGLLYK